MPSVTFHSYRPFAIKAVKVMVQIWLPGGVCVIGFVSGATADSACRRPRTAWRW